jgi:hypothetical protein
MNPTSALSSLQNSNPLRAILWAGFTSGTLDVSAALVVYQYFGRPPMRLLQGIPAGVLGSRSFQGGLPAALLGLFCHFFHRISCRYRLSYGEPLDTFPSGARRNLWCFLWRGCLLLHESRRGAPFGCHKISVLFTDVGCRRRHTHPLCRIAHRSSSTTMLNAIKISRWARPWRSQSSRCSRRERAR